MSTPYFIVDVKVEVSGNWNPSLVCSGNYSSLKAARKAVEGKGQLAYTYRILKVQEMETLRVKQIIK